MSEQESKCRGCGKPIKWAQIDGKKIPIDLKPPVYYRGDDGEWHRFAGEAGVSHFATCSDANKFSGSNKSRDTDKPKAAASDELNSAETIAFLRALDESAEIEVSDFESGFIRDMLVKADKYGDDRVKFFGGQVGVIQKMLSKYREQLGGITTNKPKQSEPKPEPPAEEEAPESSGYDNIPF